MISHQRFFSVQTPQLSRPEEWAHSTVKNTESVPTALELGPHLSPQSRSLRTEAAPLGDVPRLGVSAPDARALRSADTNSVLKQHRTQRLDLGGAPPRCPCQPPRVHLALLVRRPPPGTCQPENRRPPEERWGTGQTFRHIYIKSDL